MRIPKDLLCTRWDGRSRWNAIKLILSRFQWVTEKIIRLVNESNLDCLFEIISTPDPQNDSKEVRSLKLLSAVKVDNLFENFKTRDSPHYILDKKEFESRDVVDSLIRQNQKYKV